MSTRAPTTTPAPADRPRLLRIQEVAAEVGLTTRSIRYYEELGLLEPAARSEGDYRLFDASDLERLRFIKSLRDDAGFSLAQVGQLLEDEAARERNRERLRPHDRPGRAADLPRRGAHSRRAPDRAPRGEGRTPRLDDRRGPGPPGSHPRRPGGPRADGAMPAVEAAAVIATRRVRVPPPQLPAVLRRSGDLAGRHLDAAGRPGVARPRADPRPALARGRGRGPVHPGHDLRPVRGRPRRHPAQASDADRRRSP